MNIVLLFRGFGGHGQFKPCLYLSLWNKELCIGVKYSNFEDVKVSLYTKVKNAEKKSWIKFGLIYSLCVLSNSI